MNSNINRLRIKICLALSISFTALLVLILAIIYILMSLNTQSIIYQTLKNRLYTEEYYFEDVFFTAIIRDDDVQNLYASSYLAPELVDTLLAQSLSSSSDNDYHYISANEQTWAYMIGKVYTYDPYLIGENSNSSMAQSPYTRIVFVNVTELTDTLHRLLPLLLKLGLFSVVSAFVGSFCLANQLIKPTIRAFTKEKKVSLWQKRFIANASHSLRTPLTLVKGSYDELLDCPEETVASQKKWLDMMGFGIESIESLTSELVILANMEHFKKEFLKKELIDINKLIYDLIQVYEMKITEKKITILTSDNLGIMIKQNEEKLKQVMLILLDNAIKYVNQQGLIEIEVTPFNEKVKFVIKNSGPGISIGELPHIFERFYRGDDTSGKCEGHGLGLAIAKETIQLLGGDIFAESVVNEMTSFGFILPIECEKDSD